MYMNSFSTFYQATDHVTSENTQPMSVTPDMYHFAMSLALSHETWSLF